MKKAGNPSKRQRPGPSSPASRPSPATPSSPRSSLRSSTRSSAADLWVLLTEFAFSLRGWWIEICYSLDLTPVQGLALRSLLPESPLAMSALAEALVCDASNVTGVVDKLEARGLIARQAVENDRRVKMLVVTEKGRELRERLMARAATPPPEIGALPATAREPVVSALRAFLASRGVGASRGAGDSFRPAPDAPATPPEHN